MKDISEFAIDPAELGFRISVVKKPYAKCPFCLTTKTTMAVYEHGVQWACGCARILPDLHATAPNCRRCKKLSKAIVFFPLKLKIACVDRAHLHKQKLSA